MPYQIKLPQQIVPVELRDLPHYLWPASARAEAIHLLLQPRTKERILGDLFPRERLIGMIEQAQRAEQEFEDSLSV